MYYESNVILTKCGFPYNHGRTYMMQ